MTREQEIEAVFQWLREEEWHDLEDDAARKVAAVAFAAVVAPHRAAAIAEARREGAAQERERCIAACKQVKVSEGTNTGYITAQRCITALNSLSPDPAAAPDAREKLLQMAREVIFKATRLLPFRPLHPAQTVWLEKAEQALAALDAAPGVFRSMPSPDRLWEKIVADPDVALAARGDDKGAV